MQPTKFEIAINLKTAHALGASLLGDSADAGRPLVKQVANIFSTPPNVARLARVALPNHRMQLEQMAETWEQLAEARKRQLQKQGKTEDDDRA